MKVDALDVLDAYANGACENKVAYERIGSKKEIPQSDWEAVKPIGRAQANHSPLKRKVRWHQMTLRELGLLQPVAGHRGRWEATEKGRKTIEQRQQELEPAFPGMIKLGFSTELGVALWADCRDAFSKLDHDINCIITSPPYPLAVSRDYGNPKSEEYVDWLCACLEPAVKRMARGASLFLNVSNDIFKNGSPERSLYREELVIALHKRLGLCKMDSWIWSNPCKAPGPIQWASLKRVQLNSGYEVIYWFCNAPEDCFTDNRRILRPHTEQHARYIETGGAKTKAVFGDGANRRRVGAFSNPTLGSIERNVITMRHNCPSQKELRAWAKENGVPIHSATMPLEMAEKIVLFATEENMLVADLFSGWGTTALAASIHSRRFYVTERMRAYLHAHQWRMKHAGFEVN